MCLAVPGKIIAIAGDVATVDYGIEQRTGSLLEKEFKVGDFVIVQGGFVVDKVSEKEAEAALRLYLQACS